MGTPARDDAVDVIKGIGIFFVVTNHCFSRTMRKFLGVEVTEDLTLYAINRAIHFAVPVFLFISCAMLARSFTARPDIKRYAVARFRKTFVPYVVASILFYFLVFGSLGPHTWLDLLTRTATGRAHFHLYFTIVLIQISVVVPLLVLLLGNRRMDWRWAALAGIGLQVAVYAMQREWFQWERPASVFAWYLVPLLLGVAVGRSPVASDEIRRAMPALIVLTLTAMAAYVWASVAPLRGATASSDLINLTYAIFTAALALVLWSGTRTWPSGNAREIVRRLGEVSLPVFLIHPAVMYALGGPRITSLVERFPASMAFFWVATLLFSYLAARVLVASRLGRWVLGQGEESKRVTVASP